MATKDCPHCNKKVPVACKKCGCGHVFFATRRSATSVSRENPESDVYDPSDNPEHQPTRRSGRVTRERPNFYDALEYENQTRREEEKDDDDDEIEAPVADTTFSKVFVTVGTTRFDDLLTLMLNESTIQQLQTWKTKFVRIQKGSSILTERIEGTFTRKGIEFHIYDYKPFLTEDMEWADLVICHAGAGTTMEVLDLGKPLVVVPNRNLMDDHQLELAYKLAEGEHAVLTSISSFQDDMKKVKKSWFVPFQEKNTSAFAEFINFKVLGLLPTAIDNT